MIEGTSRLLSQVGQGIKTVLLLPSRIEYRRAVAVSMAIGLLLTLIPGVVPVNIQKAGAGSVGFKLSTTAAANNATSVIVNKPTTTITDDVMIAVISVPNSTATITPPAGWTSIQKATTATELATEAFWKRATASEPTSYTFSTNIGNTQVTGGIATYSGVVTSGSPIGNIGSNGTGSGTTMSAPVVNISTVRSKAIAVFTSEDEAPSSHTAPSSPTVMHKRFDIASSRNGVGNRDVTSSIADILRGTTGNFGANSATAGAATVYAAFQFELLASDQVHMLLFWDGTDYLGNSISLPAGWSYVDDANGFYIRGEEPSNYGVTGGNTTHTPTASTNVTGGTPADLDSGGNTPAMSSAGHTHTAPSVTNGSANNAPAFRTLRLIRYNAGITNTIPSGAIALFDGSPGIPSTGWTRISAQDNYIVKGGDTIATGGQDTHTHTIDINGNLTAGSGGTNYAGFLASVATSTVTHTHTITDTGFTTATNNTDPCDAAPVNENCLPPYVATMLAKTNGDTPTISVGFAAMFDGDPGGGWVVRSNPDPDGGGAAVEGPYYQNFIRGASAYDESCGDGVDGCGSPTHTHQQAVITTSSGIGTGNNTRNLIGNALVRNTHTHNVQVNFDPASNIPPYFNVVVGEKVNLIMTQYAWYIDNDALTPIDPWGNPDNGANTSIIVLPLTTEEPPDLGDELRLRVQILINGNDLSANTISLKMQYNATNSGSCTASTGTWVDVGDNADTDKDWIYAASSIADGTTLWTLGGTNNSVFTPQSDIPQNYVKSNTYGTNPHGAVVSETIEYDFHIQHYAAKGATQYSFRILEANGTLLSQYDYCPTLTTMPQTENQMRHGNFFKTDNANDAGSVLEEGFSWNE